MLKIIAGASVFAVAAAVPGAPDRHAKKTMNGESAPNAALGWEAAGLPDVHARGRREEEGGSDKHQRGGANPRVATQASTP